MCSVCVRAPISVMRVRVTHVRACAYALVCAACVRVRTCACTCVCATGGRNTYSHVMGEGCVRPGCINNLPPVLNLKSPIQKYYIARFIIEIYFPKIFISQLELVSSIIYVETLYQNSTDFDRGAIILSRRGSIEMIIEKVESYTIKLTKEEMILLLHILQNDVKTESQSKLKLVECILNEFPFGVK